jgi:hypothetical protein
MRRVSARSCETTVTAVGGVLTTVTLADAYAFFIAAGFSLP